MREDPLLMWSDWGPPPLGKNAASFNFAVHRRPLWLPHMILVFPHQNKNNWQSINQSIPADLHETLLRRTSKPKGNNAFWNMINDSNRQFVRSAKPTMIEYDGRYSKVSEFLTSNILLPNVLSGQTIYQDNTYSNSHENSFVDWIFNHNQKPSDILKSQWIIFC